MRLGLAIERAMRESPAIGKQTVLADQLRIDQTTVSKMINGQIAVTVERVAEIERLCGLSQGQILVWAGLVDPSVKDDVTRRRTQRGQARRPMEELVAAQGADLDQQTVSPKRRPGVDTPHDQEAP